MLSALLDPGSQGRIQKGSEHPPLLPSGIHLPRALGREEGLKWPLGPLPRLGVFAGAERHYGRHSLGLVLFIVSTGLNVSGQLYLHVAEKGHHLQLLQRKQTQRVRRRWGTRWLPSTGGQPPCASGLTPNSCFR